MQILIRHELRTAAVHFVIPLLAGILMSTACIYLFIQKDYEQPPIGNPAISLEYTWPMIFFSLAAIAMGTSQMNGDRKNKTSSYLCTLATTRRQIIASRLLVGLFWNLIAMLPAFTWFILLAMFPRLVPTDTFLLIQIAVLLFLLNAASYSVGLLFGGFEGRFIQMAALFPFLFIFCIPIIKGMNWECYAFLIVITLAAITLAVQKFLKMPL